MVLNKSHGKTADRKRAEIHELEVQMAKAFICGGCHVGFDKKQDYEEHNSCEEHNYHIMRKINTLVPGLGFCAACSCVIQTAKGWDSHVQTDKHARCTQSLRQCGIDGEYHEPLGCTSAGQIGLPVPSAQIDIKKATSHGYGHGGKMGAGIPIIGLDRVQFLGGVKYKCCVCMETFAFEHRGNHLGGNEHRLNYLRCNYPAWYMDVSSILPEHVMQIKFRLMFYAHKVEMTEKQTENSLSKVLRAKFASESTQRRPHNVGKERYEHGKYPKTESYGNVVFVKEGEKDVPTYVMRTPMPDVKKKAFNKNKGSWQQRKDREFLKNAQGDYSTGQINAIVAGADCEEFAQGSKMVFKEKEKKLLLVTPSEPKDTGSETSVVASSNESTVRSSSLQAKSVAPSSEEAQSDPASAQEGDPYDDPAMQTTESATENNKNAPDTKKDTAKRKPVMLMHSSRDSQQKGFSSRGHPENRGYGARGSYRPPRGGSPPPRGHHSRGRPPPRAQHSRGGPPRGQWDPYEDPAMMYSDGYQLQEDCYEEPYGDDYGYGYDHHEDFGYDQNLGKRQPSQLMEYPPFKKHRSSYQGDRHGSAEKALEVLEKFAKRRSQNEVFHTVQTMKDEVYNQYTWPSEEERVPQYGYEEGYCEPEGPPRHPRLGRGRGSSRDDFGPRFHGPPRGGRGPGRGFGPPRGFRHPPPRGIRGSGPRHPF